MAPVRTPLTPGRNGRLTAVLMLLIGFFRMTCAAADVTGCQLLKVAEFPIELVGSRPLVHVGINGQPARMLIDTGSQLTTLTRAAATELHLSIVPWAGVRFYGAGGSDEAGRAVVEDFTLGAVTTHRVELLTTGRHLAAGGAVGVVGEDFLSRWDVEFDFADGAMRLFQPRGCDGDQVIYWARNYSLLPIESSQASGELRAFVMLNGKRILATLDTGAFASVVTTEAARRAGVTTQSPGVAAVGTAHGIGAKGVETYSGVFTTVVLGEETIQNARLRIADLFSMNTQIRTGSHIATQAIEEPGMLLGADFFLSHRVYVARSQQKIYFSYLGGPVFRVPARRPPT